MWHAAAPKKSYKTAKEDVVGTQKDLSRDKNPLQDNKHSPQFQNMDVINQNMKKRLNKVDELISVSYIGPPDDHTSSGEPTHSVPSSLRQQLRFSGSETVETSKLLPRVLMQTGKKTAKVCNYYSNHESQNFADVIKIVLHALSLINSKY